MRHFGRFSYIELDHNLRSPMRDKRVGYCVALGEHDPEVAAAAFPVLTTGANRTARCWLQPSEHASTQAQRTALKALKSEAQTLAGSLPEWHSLRACAWRRRFWSVVKGPLMNGFRSCWRPRHT